MANGTVFTGSIAKSLKLTLEGILDDKDDGIESKVVMKRYFQVDDMKDNWVDYVEYAGGGLLPQKDEGGELKTLTMTEGYTKRFMADTFGAKMMITEEAIEDAKYPQAIKLKRRLKRSLWKTVDINSTLVLMRATNANYVGGDGVSLANASHPLPNGGVYSNTMAVPMSPSMQACIVVRAALAVLPGHDGIVEPRSVEKVVFPAAQEGVWDIVLGSKINPDPGNFSAINVANQKMSIEPVMNPYWSTTTTNYCFITDAEDGLMWLWRRRPRTRNWVDNNNEIMLDATSARWARGWGDPRGVYFVAA